MAQNKQSGSFRDPNGHLFFSDGELFRQVNQEYAEHYDHLMNSGLYEKLVDAHLLIPHTEMPTEGAGHSGVHRILKPEIIPFISYPYEWCFSQLKDAALATLRIQREAMESGMTLKDASAYNIQFRKGRPLLIDTLSFEKYQEGQLWQAYRQFCQHFLCPLALMHYTDIRLNQLARIYIDGIPLDLASKLLPPKTRFNLSLLSHIHLHAKGSKAFESKKVNLTHHRLNRHSFLGLIDNLESTIANLRWRPVATEWADYYDQTNYGRESFEHKKQIVSDFLEETKPDSVWDIGANMGVFSRIASNKGIPTISFDYDPAAVEKNYQMCVNDKETNLLPLVMDLTNPSSGIGWANTERFSLSERGPTHTLLALALIHHLAISNNLPFDNIARYFSSICKSLIIEFVPKSDSQVQKLLATRNDTFPAYAPEEFTQDFSKYFKILCETKVKSSERTIFLMQKVA